MAVYSARAFFYGALYKWAAFGAGQSHSSLDTGLLIPMTMLRCSCFIVTQSTRFYKNQNKAIILFLLGSEKIVRICVN